MNIPHSQTGYTLLDIDEMNAPESRPLLASWGLSS